MTEVTPKITRGQLLAAKKVSLQPVWQAETDSAPLLLRPFKAIEDEPYLTYVNAG
jgi:hypothetical protein